MEAEVNRGYWSVEPTTPAESDNASCSLDSRLAFNSNLDPDSCASTVLTGESEDEGIFSAQDHFVSLQQPPKDPRSKAKYNILSRLFFFWLEPLFYLGAHRELQQEDLYAHPLEADSQLLLAKFNWYWKRELKRRTYGQYPRLWVALCKCILWRFILQGLLILIEAGILLFQSVVLGYLTEYFNIEDPTPQDTRNAYLYAFGLVMLSLVVIVMHSHSFLMGQKMSMMLRITSTAAIFKKVLSLTQASISRLSVGHVVNLASNDVQRFDPVFPHFPYIWVSPLHLTVFTYLAFQEVGWTAFLASGFIILQVPLQVLFARLFVKFRFKSASLTDKRINIMSEVLTGIRVIKMYTWEYAFKDIVSKLRKKESSIVFKGAIIRACNLAYMIVSTSIIMWLVLTVHTSTGGELSTQQVFTLLSLLTTLRLSSYFFVLALLGFSEGRVAIQRIQNFLEQDNDALPKLGNSPGNKTSLFSRKKSKGCVYPVISNCHSTDKIKLSATCYTDSMFIKVTNMSASWSYNREKTVLDNISFEVNESIPLLAVIGPVGSGKSSLIHCLLGELKALEGTVTVKGSVSYVSQDPWIFAGTVRDNILFGEKFDKIWYERVLEACSLDEDIHQLPERDFTLVGERGVTLSGGQKARVNLARAIYRDSLIYLLDDPFSALDVNVAMHIYDNCLRGLLEDRLVVLVTHQIQFALPADKILLIKNGQQEVYSSNEELLAQGLDPAHLIGLIQDDDEDGDEMERNMFSYKNTFEPPSPTTVSMLSTDNIAEDGHITPFSFTSSVYNGNFEARSPVMTPLALFSKSMRDMQLHTSTSIVPRRKRPEVFVYPIAEGDEPDAVAKPSLPRIAMGSPDNSTEHPNKFPNSPILGSNPPIETLEISHPAWPFATSPPGNSTALNAEEHTEEVVVPSPHDAWPFAKTSPSHTSEIKQSNAMPVHEVWPFASNPPAKIQLANGNALLPSSGATSLTPSSEKTAVVKEQPWPFAGKPPAATSSLSHTTIAAKTNATNQPQLSGEDDRDHSPTPHPTINLLPPTPPLGLIRLEHSNPKKSVHISKVKPSPLILSANSRSVDHSNPPHMMMTRSPRAHSQSPCGSPRSAKKTSPSSALHQSSASHFTVLWKASRSPTPSRPSTLLHPNNNATHSLASGRKAPLSPTLSPPSSLVPTTHSLVAGRKALSPTLSPPSTLAHPNKTTTHSPAAGRKAPLSPTLSPPSTLAHLKTNTIHSPISERKASPSPTLTSVYERKVPMLSIPEKAPINLAHSPPISPRYFKKSPLVSPSYERKAPLASVGKTSQIAHIIVTPPASPRHSKTSPFGTPRPFSRSFSSPPRFKGTTLLSPVHASFKTSPVPSRGRTPFTSPLPGRSKSVMDDDVHTVSLEPGRFDAASIYSARSVRSVASVVANKITATNFAAEEKSLADAEPEQIPQEGKRTGTVSLRTYYDFFKAGGGILLVTIALLLFILGEVAIVVSDWWLSDWANCFSTVTSSLLANESSGNSTCNLNSDSRISVYTATTLSATILSFSRAIFFCFLCINASRVLHNHMFDTILRAKILFFDTNPIGKILNRFSKDIGFLDDLLPYTFCEFILLFLRCLAVIATAAASNAWLLIPAFIIIIVFILLRWYYLRSARDVKRLEAIARSPVYSHLSSTLQGLSTIRSYQRENVTLQQLHEVQNQHSQGWYLYLVMVRWFGLRIDMLSVLFLASVAFISIPLSSQLNAGLVGLSLTYTISLADMLQYMIRLSAEVENTMISAERVIEYGKLDPETLTSTTEKPPEDWPTEGEVKMDNVMFQYAADAPMVLQNLSFTIKEGEKVGIVGRTGAGKSSLIAVLYRLAEPNGQITIDGVETKSIGLHDLRKKMSIIPQDPVLFSGSMRYNLDPFEEYSDAELWEVLEQVQLKAAVEELEGQLSGEVSEGGSNFSVGQRQLVCLARALLRKNKILILDEATANVDPRTDGIIQKAIHETFANCTTLVIAHRLDTIMDSDKILLLKNGRVKEFDSPYRLLQNPSSKFYLMVEKTGLTASGRLHQMALESHLRRMFKKNGRITPAQSRVGVKKMSSLFAQSLLQRSTGSGPFGLSRLQERRASILSSNSFPRALNELGIGGPGIVNSNDPNLSSLRLPSDSHLPKESD